MNKAIVPLMNLLIADYKNKHYQLMFWQMVTKHIHNLANNSIINEIDIIQRVYKIFKYEIINTNTIYM